MHRVPACMLAAKFIGAPYPYLAGRALRAYLSKL
jgi:hypothetical protein